MANQEALTDIDHATQRRDRQGSSAPVRKGYLTAGRWGAIMALALVVLLSHRPAMGDPPAAPPTPPAAPPDGPPQQPYQCRAQRERDLIFNVKDFGALGNGEDDDTQAFQEAIKALPMEGGRLEIPPGVYVIKETLELKGRRSTQIVGFGFGHPTEKTGSILKWGCKAGGTILHLNGFSQSSVERLALDGNGKTAAVGIHLEGDETSNVVSQKNEFRQVLFGNLKIGLKIGETLEDQGNNDQSDLYSCWFRDNDVGILFQGDQAVQWILYNCQFLCHADAAIRTGAERGNSGGFQMYGGAFLNNEIDLDLPRITAPIVISGVSTEKARIFLRNVTPLGAPHSGDHGRSVILQGVWQNSAKSDRTAIDLEECKVPPMEPGEEEYAIRFTTSNNLLVMGCQFVRPVIVDHFGGGGTESVARTFINTQIDFGDGTVTQEDNGPGEYEVIEIGKPGRPGPSSP